MTKQMTMGVIIGNRGFFPDHLARDGREEMIRAVEMAGMKAVALGPEDTKYGAVETREEAQQVRRAVRRQTRTKSTASSFRCPISETSAPWRTRCAWRTSMFRC